MPLRACSLRLLCAAALAVAAHGQFKHRGGKGPRKHEPDFDTWAATHGTRARARADPRRAPGVRSAATIARRAAAPPQATPFLARSTSCAARTLTLRVPKSTRTMRAGEG